MDATNEWMDETEKLLKSFSIGMEPEEATKLQEKTEVCFLFFFLFVFAFIEALTEFSWSQNLLQRLLLLLALHSDALRTGVLYQIPSRLVIQMLVCTPYTSRPHQMRKLPFTISFGR